MKHPSKLGICIKSSDGAVLEQNSLCVSICGRRIGEICPEGCLILFPMSKRHPALNEGIQLRRNVNLLGHDVDLAIVNDGSHLTTMLYPLGTKIERELAALRTFGLSKRELEISGLLLHGLSNPDLARQLCISIATLKTHLNNIYKKLPPELVSDLRGLNERVGRPVSSPSRPQRNFKNRTS